MTWFSGLNTEIEKIWESVDKPIVLGEAKVGTRDISLRDLQDELEVELTNKKHVQNGPTQVETTLQDIGIDADKVIVQVC